MGTAARGSHHFGDEVMDATRQILNIGSAAIDVVTLIAEVDREVPIASAVLQVFIAIHDMVETVRANKEDLKGLRDRCRYLTACVIQQCRRSPVAKHLILLENILRETADVIKRCNGRKRVMRIVKATSDKNEIQSLHIRLNQLGIDIGLAAKIRMVTLIHQGKLSSSDGTAPEGAPIRKSWYVYRPQIVQDVYDRLCRGESPKLVTLAGESGSGKTTVAAEIAMDSRVRSFFSDGIVWLSVDDGASDRLPSLMARLAGMVDKHMSRAAREDIINSRSGAKYIKQRMEQGRQGKGLTYLVVADNVWGIEVVNELRKTGMWILVTTRDRKVVECSANDSVGTVKVGEMSEDAELVLKRSAGLNDNVRLPDAAMEVVELCGKMAMDLAFVGSWDLVRGRNDPSAWEKAVDAITTELKEVSESDCTGSSNISKDTRREAILRAGFKQLGNRLQTLYMSLAVMPDGHSFTVDNAASLLYDREIVDEDMAAVKQVVENLERWSILRSYGGLYKMHDAHAAIGRKELGRNEDVRESAVQRWTKFISTLAALRSFDNDILKGLWLAVQRVGGVDVKISRQYMAQLEDMDESDPDMCLTLSHMGHFLSIDNEWLDASRIWSKALHLQEHLIDAGSPHAVFILNYLVQCAENLGQVDEAEQWRQKRRRVHNLALARTKSHSQDHSLEINASSRDDELVMLAIATSIHRSNPEANGQAEDLLKRALRIEEARENDSLKVASILLTLGGLIMMTGRSNEAERMMRQSLEIKKARLGEGHIQLSYTLHELGVLLRDDGRYDEAEEMFKEALLIEKTKLGENDLQVAITLHTLGVCLRTSGRYDKAEEMFKEALKIETAKLGEDNLQVATTFHELGLCLRTSGRYDGGEDMLRKALGIRQAKLGEDDLEVAKTLHELGVCLWTSGPYNGGEEMMRRALAIGMAKLGEDDLTVATMLHELGACLWKSRRYDGGEEMLTKALAIKQAKLGENDLQIAITLHELGVCLWRSGRCDGGEEMLRRALAIKQEKLGKDDFHVAITLHELGLCLQMNGRYDGGEEMLRRALAIGKAKLGENDLTVATILNDLGLCLRTSGRYDGGEEMLRRALAIKQEKLGGDNLEVAKALHELGVCLRMSGQCDGGEEMLRGAWSIEKAKLGEDNLMVAITLHELGVCLSDNGRYGEAENMFMKTLAIGKAKLGEDDLQVSLTLQALGVCLRKSGCYDKAEEKLNQALATQKTKLGEENLQVAHAMYELGVCIRDSGRPEEAKPLLLQTLQMFETKKGEDDIEISASQIQLAVCLRQTGKSLEADKLFELSSKRIETKHENNDSISVALVRLRLGLYAWRSGWQERASRLLRRALSVTDATGLEKDIRVVAGRLHKYSISLGMIELKEEVEGLLSYVLGIDESSARVAWLASQNGLPLWPTE